MGRGDTSIVTPLALRAEKIVSSLQMGKQIKLTKSRRGKILKNVVLTIQTNQAQANPNSFSLFYKLYTNLTSLSTHCETHIFVSAQFISIHAIRRQNVPSLHATVLILLPLHPSKLFAFNPRVLWCCSTSPLHCISIHQTSPYLSQELCLGSVWLPAVLRPWRLVHFSPASSNVSGQTSSDANWDSSCCNYTYNEGKRHKETNQSWQFLEVDFACISQIALSSCRLWNIFNQIDRQATFSPFRRFPV